MDGRERGKGLRRPPLRTPSGFSLPLFLRFIPPMTLFLRVPWSPSLDLLLLVDLLSVPLYSLRGEDCVAFTRATIDRDERAFGLDWYPPYFFPDLLEVRCGFLGKGLSSCGSVIVGERIGDV